MVGVVVSVPEWAGHTIKTWKYLTYRLQRVRLGWIIITGTPRDLVPGDSILSPTRLNFRVAHLGLVINTKYWPWDYNISYT